MATAHAKYAHAELLVWAELYTDLCTCTATELEKLSPPGRVKSPEPRVGSCEGGEGWSEGGRSEGELGGGRVIFYLEVLAGN